RLRRNAYRASRCRAGHRRAHSSRARCGAAIRPAAATLSEAARRQAAGGVCRAPAMSGFFSARVILDEVTPLDADALVAIHGAAFARAWSSDDFAALTVEQTVFALALRRQGFFGGRHLIGFALVRAVADEGEILTVAVAKAERGRGFGRLLMEEALRRLYREGATACFLEVDEANEAAVRLYRALGFEVVGERKGYYQAAAGGEGTALVMRVQLR